MEIVDIRINEIAPYVLNAKIHDSTQVSNVAESIRQFGMLQPLVIDKDNNLIIGHCRLLALKKLKKKTAPCVRAEDLTNEQIKKLRILDNKLNESEWDLDSLVSDIKSLDFGDFDVDFPTLDIDVDDEEEQEEKPKKKKKVCPNCGWEF